ncbi:MAG: hypothetical protein ABSE75_09715 [Acidimicrobiales bacterium]
MALELAYAAHPSNFAGVLRSPRAAQSHTVDVSPTKNRDIAIIGTATSLFSTSLSTVQALIDSLTGFLVDCTSDFLCRTPVGATDNVGKSATRSAGDIDATASRIWRDGMFAALSFNLRTILRLNVVANETTTGAAMITTMNK